MFALVGSALGVLITSLLSLMSARTQRRRLSREYKVAAYPQLADAGRKLARTSVWPVEAGTTEQLLEKLLELAEQTAFFSPPQVNAAVRILSVAAKEHQNTITSIRDDSTPGHRNSVDRRFQEKYRKSLTALHRAIDDFVRVGRSDLEIRGPYHSIENNEKPADETNR